MSKAPKLFSYECPNCHFINTFTTDKEKERIVCPRCQNKITLSEKEKVDERDTQLPL